MSKLEKHTQSHTGRIDELRVKSWSEQLIHTIRGKHDSICAIDSVSELQLKLREVFPHHKILQEFFYNHPVCWFDLLRKLHKYRINSNEGNGWFIPEKDIGDIYGSFLTRWRKTDSVIGKKLRNILPDAITKNQNLLRYASDQPSLLDDSGYSLGQIPKMQRKNNIKKLISFGLLKNIQECTYDNIDAHFSVIFPKMLRYLDEIYAIHIPITYCTTLDQLVTVINKMVDSGSGVQREDAFRVIQAFHAWSGIENIEKLRAEAESCIEEVPTLLKNIGFTVSNIQKNEHNDASIYSGTITHNDDRYRVEWRVKTVKSILQKMWETEEYTNIDAIRDILGIAIIFPDDTTTDNKIDIISKIGSLMSDFGYVLKDKGWLKDDIVKVEANMVKQKKHPIHTTDKRGETTDDKLSNTSLSGYTHIWWKVIGTEVQFSTASAAEWKKVDDKKYKPRSAIKALMRWPKFTTPRKCYNLINKRVDLTSMKALGYADINQMLLGMIDDKFLKPYVSEDGEILLFTCNGKEKGFKSEFPTMKPCTPENQYHSKMLDFLQELN